jgi:hypothetical protein
MSAVVRPGLAPAPMAPAPATVAGPVSQLRVVRAEWTKLWALRSTKWCGLSAFVLIVGLGAVIGGSGTPYHVSPGNSAAAGVSVSLLGVLFAQLLVGVVGVLAFSGEYGTGMIRGTLAVVPSRLPVLWAKLIVLAGLVLPVTLLCAVVNFFAATVPDRRRHHWPGPGHAAPQDRDGPGGVRRGVLRRTDRRGGPPAQDHGVRALPAVQRRRCSVGQPADHLA